MGSSRGGAQGGACVAERHGERPPFRPQPFPAMLMDSRAQGGAWAWAWAWTWARWAWATDAHGRQPVQPAQWQPRRPRLGTDGVLAVVALSTPPPSCRVKETHNHGWRLFSFDGSRPDRTRHRDEWIGCRWAKGGWYCVGGRRTGHVGIHPGHRAQGFQSSGGCPSAAEAHRGSTPAHLAVRVVELSIGSLVWPLSLSLSLTLRLQGERIRSIHPSISWHRGQCLPPMARPLPPPVTPTIPSRAQRRWLPEPKRSQRPPGSSCRDRWQHSWHAASRTAVRRFS